uniref:rolling circle replication-associated protein n=1 Tax=Lentilactobacillus hilgardii TaxID=1588 RepID=UPI00403F3BBB
MELSDIKGDDRVTIHDYYNKLELVNSPSNYRRSTQKASIKKRSNNEYINLQTGEIKQFKHHNHRSKASFNHSFTILKDKLYCNFKGEPNELFATLTFDNKKAPIDLAFNHNENHNHQIAKYCKQELKKLIRKIKQQLNKDDAQLIYITIMEPQKNGVPHFHLLLKLLNSESINLSETVLNNLWSHGIVDIKNLYDTTNLAAYFHAHLTDLPVNEATSNDLRHPHIISRQQKKYIKGARLKYFPNDINYFSCSRNLKTSTKTETNADQARQFAKKRGYKFDNASSYTIQLPNDQLERVNRELWVPAPT